MALLIVRQTFIRVHGSLHVSPVAMETRVAVVTGGNRGVGLEICRQLASNGILVVLTARDEKKGSQAVKALEQSGLSGVNNAAIGGTTIDPERLRELLEQDPKASFQEDLMGFLNSYMGSLQQNYEMAKECLEINFYGTKDVTDCLMPLLLLSNSGKVINLTSKISQLQFISNEGVIKVLSDIDNLSDEKLKDVASIFLKDFKDGNLEAHGWQPVVSAYAVSKTLVNAYSRLLAKRHPSLEVCCVNPGFVKTDMNYGIGLISVEEGANAPVPEDPDNPNNISSTLREMFGSLEIGIEPSLDGGLAKDQRGADLTGAGKPLAAHSRSGASGRPRRPLAAVAVAPSRRRSRGQRPQGDNTFNSLFGGFAVSWAVP
ncbi:Os02g0640600 [Oryza sativa Japonica Group]|uniref:Os02g0640600 protein n=1 Tax=Oryza sativa subsp. japonica TaxID=39947 RepID=A0A0P0VMG5_ORYSJ|nr:hypothetical protein EE612_012638 [Oryza sativa]BAS79983.1 Os02g0640600 [Oryza sativa Japonica Group]